MVEFFASKEYSPIDLFLLLNSLSIFEIGRGIVRGLPSGDPLISNFRIYVPGGCYLLALNLKGFKDVSATVFWLGGSSFCSVWKSSEEGSISLLV